MALVERERGGVVLVACRARCAWRRARAARSIASVSSASPRPLRRASARTKRSSSHASGAAFQTLKRKRSCRTPAGGESSSGVASRNSASGSSKSRSTEARNAFADGQSWPMWSRNATSSAGDDLGLVGLGDPRAGRAHSPASSMTASTSPLRTSVALGDRQLGDDAGLVRGDLVLHLHRLDDRDERRPRRPSGPARPATFQTLPCIGEASVSLPRRGALRASSASARARLRGGAGAAPLAARRGGADDAHVEPAPGDLDGVGLLDAPPSSSSPGLRGAGSNGERLQPRRDPRAGRGRSRRAPTARWPAARGETGSASSGPRSRTPPSARSMRAVACSRSASQTMSLATIGSYIGETTLPARTPESTRTPGPDGST